MATKVASIRLPLEDWQRLDHAAHDTGQSRNKLIRLAILSYLANTGVGTGSPDTR